MVILIISTFLILFCAKPAFAIPSSLILFGSSGALSQLSFILACTFFLLPLRWILALLIDLRILSRFNWKVIACVIGLIFLSQTVDMRLDFNSPSIKDHSLSIEDLTEAMNSSNWPLIIDGRGKGFIECSTEHIAGSICLKKGGKLDFVNAAKEQLEKNPSRQIIFLCGAGWNTAYTAKLANKLLTEELGRSTLPIKSIRGGLAGIKLKNYRLPIKFIRKIPPDQAEIWIKKGYATKFNITKDLLLKDATLSSLNQTLKRSSIPLGIYLSDISADKIEFLIHKNNILSPRFYVDKDSIIDHKIEPTLFKKNLRIFFITWSNEIWLGIIILHFLYFLIIYHIRKREMILHENQRNFWKNSRYIVTIIWLIFLANILPYYYQYSAKKFFTSHSYINILWGFLIILSLNLQIIPRYRKKILHQAVPCALKKQSFLRSIPIDWNLFPIAVLFYFFNLQHYYVFPLYAARDIMGSMIYFTIACFVLEQLLCRLFSLPKPIKWPLWAILAIIFQNTFIPLFFTFCIVASITISSWLVIDLILVFNLKKQLKRKNAITCLLKLAGIPFKKSTSNFQLHTKDKNYPGRFLFQKEDTCFHIGIATDQALNTIPPEIEITNEEIKQASTLAKRIRLLIQQDAVISFHSADTVEGIDPIKSSNTIEDIIHETILYRTLNNYGSKPDQLRFDSSLMNEVSTFPTPLTLEYLQRRWSSKGAATTALSYFGIRYFSTKKPYVTFGSKLYQDLISRPSSIDLKKERASLQKWVTSISCNLFFKTAKETFDLIVSPKSRQRILSLQNGQLPPNNKKALELLVTSIKSLSEESAVWQEKVSFAHGYIYEELNNQLNKYNLTLQDLPLQTEATSIYSSQPIDTYELYHSPKIIQEALPAKFFSTKNFAIIRKLYNQWIIAEQLKKQANKLFHEELSEVSRLLHEFGTRYDLGKDISLLHLSEIGKIHKTSQQVLQRIIADRKRIFNEGAKLSFPSKFSLADLEMLDLLKGTTNLYEDNTANHKGFRASGPNHAVTGNVHIVTSYTTSISFKPNDIIVTQNIDPQLMPSLKDVKGIITEQGGMLSHSAILARELGITAIMGYSQATSIFKNGDYIKISSNGSVESIIFDPNSWVPLDTITSEGRYGNKAERLGLLMRKGFSVPKGVALSHNIFEAACNHWKLSPSYGEDNNLPEGLLKRLLPEEILGHLENIINFLTIPSSGLIVRSSTNIEDNEGFSSAGIFHSQHNIHNITDLAEAICQCWQSALTNKALALYSKESSLPLRINLVIQHYVASDFGGVLFTRHPLNHDNLSYLVEISDKGAHGVVSGSNIIARGTVSEKGDIVETENLDILCSVDLRQLCQIARNVKTLFNEDQDIEWLSDKQNCVYILQSRNITSP